MCGVRLMVMRLYEKQDCVRLFASFDKERMVEKISLIMIETRCSGTQEERKGQRVRRCRPSLLLLF